MKKVIFVLAIAALLFSCQENPRGGPVTMTVLKDCTGTYLLDSGLLGDHYKVCNLDMTDSFPDGAIVQVEYNEINNCNNQAIECMMLHEYESFIQVDQISY